MMKSILGKVKSSSGITLIELFVALFLTSLLAILIVSANVFVSRFIGDWEDNNTVYNEGEFIISAIADDLKGSLDFKKSDSLSYVIYLSPVDSITYGQLEGKLSRNGKIINSVNISCLNLDISKNSIEKMSPDSILIKGKPEYSEIVATINLKLKYKKSVEVFKTSLRIKNENSIY